jgi:hypothetical protein
LVFSFDVSLKGLPFCFVVPTPTPLEVSKSTHYFLFHLYGILKRFLGPGSLKCPETFLVCWQVALPISSGGAGFISL